MQKPVNCCKHCAHYVKGSTRCTSFVSDHYKVCCGDKFVEGEVLCGLENKKHCTGTNGCHVAKE